MSTADGREPPGEVAAPSLGGLIPEEGAETQPDPLLGNTVGDIQIAEVLGRGGFRCVYLGRDTKLGRDVPARAWARSCVVCGIVRNWLSKPCEAHQGILALRFS